MPTTSFRRRCTWLVFILSLAISLVFVTTNGAWTSDLGGDPDEAAHAVTSLMVRDFLAGGWQRPPLAFAQQYYADFPKVALGHYPPGFYLLAGLWLLPLVSIKSLLVLQAIIASFLSALIYRLASKLVSIPAAITAGLLMAALPLCLKQIQIVMSDTSVALLGLLAVMLWRDYLNRPSIWRSLGFGLLAAAAILTKGSGMGLCVIPPLATVLVGRWSLLKQKSWWLAALPVALLAGPWMIYSTKITAEGMTQLPLQEFFKEALIYYSKALPHTLGWLFLILASAGVVFMVILSTKKSALAASLCAMLTGALLIILIVPSGLTERYLLPAMPVLLMAVVFCADLVCSRLFAFRWVAFFTIMLGGYWLVASWPQKEVQGFGTAVSKSGIPTSKADAANWLVASDPRGEGAVIAAAAFNCTTRSPSILRVYRGSKELASSDWMGRGYTPAFQNEGQLLDHLERLKIRRVFLDLSTTGNQNKEHERLLERALNQAPDSWTLDFNQKIIRSPGQSVALLVYKHL